MEKLDYQPLEPGSNLADKLKKSIRPSTVFYTAILIIVGFFVLYPLALVIIQSIRVGNFGQEYYLGLSNWIEALHDKNIKDAIWNTITLSVMRQLIAIVIGVFLAWLIARTDLPGGHWLEVGFWIALFMPTLTVTLSWIMIFDWHNGLLNTLIEKIPFIDKGPFNIYSYWGIIWVHLLTGTIPVKIMMLAPAMRNMNASLEEASLTSGASTIGTIFRITVPIMVPVILVAVVLGLIRSMEGFEVELILGAPDRIHVYSTLIYNFIKQEPPLYGHGSVLSIAALLMIVPMVIAQQMIIARKNYTTVSGKFSTRTFKLGKWKWPAFSFVFLFVFIMTIVPLLMVVVGSFKRIFGMWGTDWTTYNWHAVLSNSGFIHGLNNTLILSIGTMLISIPILFLITYISVKSSYRLRGSLDFLSWMPTAIPGIVVSLGFLWMVLSTPVFQPLYGTMIILVIAVLFGNMTFGIQLMKGGMLQIGNELEEASYVSGASLFYSMRRIILPLIAPTVAVVAVTIFASAARSVAHVALLSTPSNKPLAMLQLDMMYDGRLEAATVIGVIIMFMTVGIAIAAKMIGLNLGPKR